MTKELYVLYGYWNTKEYDGGDVIMTSFVLKDVQKKLQSIAANFANKNCITDENVRYVTLYGNLEETHGERQYEVLNPDGEYAKFYIVEQKVWIPNEFLGECSRQMERIDRTRDIERFLHDLYEGDNIEPWKYEYMSRNGEVIDAILLWMDKLESCNVPYNITLETAVENVRKDIILDDEKLEYLWEEFGSRYKQRNCMEIVGGIRKCKKSLKK